MGILRKIWQEYKDGPFLPTEAMELCSFNELPESVRTALKRTGPGIGATKAMARFLGELGCVRLADRSRHGYYFVAPPMSEAGLCRECGQETGNLTYHARFCLEPAAVARIARAGAHALPNEKLRREQRYRLGVSDLAVARVLELLERDVTFVRRLTRGWTVRDSRITLNVPSIVSEMLRMGLAREFEDQDGWHLAPALVHLARDGESACRLDAEKLGARRVRLVDDLTLVDCLNCERAVSKNVIRGL